MWKEQLRESLEELQSAYPGKMSWQIDLEWEDWQFQENEDQPLKQKWIIFMTVLTDWFAILTKAFNKSEMKGYVGNRYCECL